MALKALMLRKRIDDKNKELRSVLDKEATFETREAELEATIMEAETEEEKKVIDEEIENYNKEKEDTLKEKESIQKEIEDLEAELAAEEELQRSVNKKVEVREEGEIKKMENRTKFFNMTIQERDEFFANEKVKDFVAEVRAIIGKEKRALNNVELTIPQVALPLIKQVSAEASKLMKYVNLRYVSGTSRQNIMGDIPEAFWDEMCAALKELDLGFYVAEMDGFKVSGYFAVCNAVLEDNDVALVSELINALGKAIGKAIDKAIIYGKGVKMPMGIVTSLTTASAPTNYPSKGRPWADLTSTNILTGTNATGTKLFQEIVRNSGVIDNEYNTNSIVWMMNNKTKVKLLSESIGINSSAALVAGMGNTMPVVGGNIEDFSFIPDDTIIFGYMKAYTLVERAGTNIAQSEHVKFLDDQTVFRGTARYDGQPIIREAFAVMGVGKAPVTTAPLFAGESAE